MSEHGPPRRKKPPAGATNAVEGGSIMANPHSAAKSICRCRINQEFYAQHFPLPYGDQLPADRAPLPVTMTEADSALERKLSARRRRAEVQGDYLRAAWYSRQVALLRLHRFHEQNRAVMA